MIAPTYNVLLWSNGTKHVRVSDGVVTEITVNTQQGYDRYTGGEYFENVFDELTATGSGPGSSPFGTLMSKNQDERNSPVCSGLQLLIAKTYAQNAGTPDPSLVTFDVKVDGVSVLAAPVTVEFTGALPDGTDDVVIPLPLAAASFYVSGLSKIELICSGSWSGNEEGGEFPPSFLGAMTLQGTV